MSDHASPTLSPYAAAADKLRETAKWLFGGIVITAGTIFAGSSLTTMGSLVLGWRLGLVALGLGVGFLGLAFLAAAAIKVLTLDLGTPRMIAQDEKFAEVREELNSMFRDSWQKSSTDFASFVELVDKEFSKDKQARDEALLSRASAALSEMTALAGFLLVRNQFLVLVRGMRWQVLLMAVGFGLFAWAANPPDTPGAPEPGLEFKITY